MWDKMQTGAKNNIGLSTNTTIAKYFTFSLSGNIDNVLTTKRFQNITIRYQSTGNYSK
jgi:hypothetical protein